MSNEDKQQQSEQKKTARCHDGISSSTPPEQRPASLWAHWPTVMNCLKLMPLVIVVIGMLLCKPVAADENDFRCFKSIGLKNPLRLQFTFRADKDDLGYVTYQRGSGRMQVKKINEKELRRVPGGRPSEFEMTWQEITPDGSGGRYVMVVQGARIYNFSYMGKKSGKAMKFEEDLGAFSEKGCRWIKE